MLKSKHFKTEQELIDYANKWKVYIRSDIFRQIVKDHTNGDWILFYVSN